MPNTIIEQLQWRYATKKFDATKKLSEKKIKTLKQAFNLTATSYGLQPLKMVVITNAELKNKLVPITMDQQQVANASHVLVICTEKSLTPDFIRQYFKNVEGVRKTPKAILDPFEDFLVEEFTQKPANELKIWMQKQAYLAMGNLLTVCALEKIDACPIEGFEPQKYDELLELKQKRLESVLVIAVGHRAEDDLLASLAKVRRGVEEVVITIK